MSEQRPGKWILPVGFMATLVVGVLVGVQIQFAICQKYHATTYAPQAVQAQPDANAVAAEAAAIVMQQLSAQQQQGIILQSAVASTAPQAAQAPAPAPQPAPPQQQAAVPTSPVQPVQAVQPPPQISPPQAKQPQESADLTVAKDWFKEISEYKTELGTSPGVGPDSAPVKVFVISDFQCPVCRRAAEGMDGLMDQYGEKVQFVFWHNPLDMHPRAMPAAKASQAAHRQGKFWQYHNMIFANPRALDDATFTQYAQTLGLDMAKFAADMADPTLEAKLRSDQALTKKIDAMGTPAFVINGKKQVGWGSAGGIKSMIDMEVRAMENLMASGLSPAEARAKRAMDLAENPEQAQAIIDHMFEGKKAE